jgi:transcriptional regulator with XRE-family HTH domain
MEEGDDGPRAILAENVEKLMRVSKSARRDLSSPHRLQSTAGVSKSQVYRILSGSMGATIDFLAELASAFGLQPWQLLVPKLDVWVDANRRLCVVTPIEAITPPQSENLKRAHAAVRDLSEEERLALFAAIQAQPALDHEVEARMPATKTKPVTNADEIIKRARVRSAPVKKATKKSA